VTRLGEEHPEYQQTCGDGFQDRVAQIEGEKRTHGSAQRYEDGCLSALSPVDEPLPGETDGSHESEHDDAQSVRAIGHVLRQAEESECEQSNGASVTRQGANLPPFREPTPFYPCPQSEAGSHHGRPEANRLRLGNLWEDQGFTSTACAPSSPWSYLGGVCTQR
jgi:hypothetical protein